MFNQGFGFHHGQHSRRGFGLKYWILSLASKEPLIGSEIGAIIAQSSGGRWSPSPGSLYITLKDLMSEGLLSMTEKDGRKYYKTTEQGAALLKDSWFPWHQFVPSMAKQDESFILDRIEENTNALTETLKNPSDKQKTKIKDVIEKLNKIIK
jgi:DNA-binding PadR family transcriptional regulator